MTTSQLHVAYGSTVIHHVYRNGSKDRYGKPTPGFAPPVDLPGVGVDAPQSADVLAGTTQRAEVELVLFVPPGVQVSSRDEFTVAGNRYSVVGVAPPITNFFTGTSFYTEVSLRRTNG